ncbi:uncharacterized protein METZ01_LOCUS344188, partial [marine metagenome]
MKSAYASGLFKTIVTPVGLSFLPIVILIVPTNVPMATSSAVIPAMSLVTLLTSSRQTSEFMCPSRLLRQRVWQLTVSRWLRSLLRWLRNNFRSLPILQTRPNNIHISGPPPLTGIKGVTTSPLRPLLPLVHVPLKVLVSHYETNDAEPSPVRDATSPL